MDASDTTGPTLDDVFRALADRRRRLALVALLESETPLTIDELAADIVAREREERSTDGSARETERARIELHHKQLPHLVDADLVRGGIDGQPIEPTARVDEIESLLPMASSENRSDD
ncbi:MULTISPECIES: DUF7344 domain-containing protein [Natrialbaceae]|uniref:DUF7344 domain-containing protein n=1 Tax=Natrialbaceae TaxID=1644061 RepID=UPI00207D5298|nr:hypothetical protein [Natronococcus sp. CG52]